MSYHDSRLYSEDRCLQVLLELRFPRARCPSCGRRGAYHRHWDKQCFTCNCGKSHIFPRKGTIFGSSHLPLLTWIHAIFLLSRAGKRITAHQLARTLNVAYPSAWRMRKRIEQVLRTEKGGLRAGMSFDEVLRTCARTDVTQIRN